jgi:outer membrane protein
VALPRIGGTPVTDRGTWSPATSTLAAVGAGQELFDFGRIAAQAAVADAATETERQRADAERLRVDLLVRETYYAVGAARAVLQAADEAYERARVHRDMAAAGVRTGLHPPVEVTRAEADLTRFDVGRIRASGGLRTAQASFSAAVGVDEPLLDAVAGAAAPAVAPSADETRRRALDGDPVLRAARARVRGAEAAARAVGAELRPDLSLSAALSARAGTAEPSSGPTPDRYGPLPAVPNWDVALVLRWPLYDPVVAARRRTALARVDVARADVAALEQQESAAVEQAHVAFEVAGAALRALEQALEAARANYAQAEARFRAGLGTSLELADAEAVRTDAEIQLAVGRFDVARAHAALVRLMGGGGGS